jgi:hypothetical protein
MSDQINKHHIIPKWKCRELNIDPDFEDNYAYPTRSQHAAIHWGYFKKDLTPLLEICNPPQYVLDMIPLGHRYDAGAATILSKPQTFPSYAKKSKDREEYNRYMREYQKEIKHHLPQTIVDTMEENESLMDEYCDMPWEKEFPTLRPLPEIGDRELARLYGLDMRTNWQDTLSKVEEFWEVQFK